ncbi:lipid-A-disaccharide synthase [Zavarzinia compransoris]|uniref:Lipid-A-disaccharide synthase n=1 Tax=Zavarzinia compransoris TaxID=1264899 RepID=A0A317E9N5_9PROT|nr:lipid-A-disaccharide synthase [Zavarzinia compransoris]PWR23828.1 lipid-A-disaccharide synthase [Zavarzinia compransoris]TDP48063.1 lipid-A-disaccharide synthase [Zavarzinia compransoris]
MTAYRDGLPAARPLHVFIIAGEPSGDALGARVMAALKRETGGAVRFTGVGGPLMTGEGMASQFPMAELTLLGVLEVLPKAAHVLRRVREVAAAILDQRPDVVVTVDAPAFSFRVGKKIKGQGIPHIHYVAPTVWAWRPRRAKMVAGFLSHLLVLFPFEPPYFERHGLATSFVGHSVVEGAADADSLRAGGAALLARLGIDPGRPVLVVLPGSRSSEVKRLGPVFGAALGLLAAQFPGLAVLVPTVPNVAGLVKAAVADWPLPVHVLEDAADKLPAMAAAGTALAASGTVALELALAETPMVIAYRANPLSVLVVRMMAKVRFANLINIIEDRAIVPELLQSQCTPEKLAAATGHLMRDEGARAEQVGAMRRVMTALGRGGPAPSARAARAILAALRPL